MVYYDKNGIVIRDLQQSDAQIITDEEIAQGWDATIDKYEMRLRHQAEGKAIALAAEWNGSIAGYINVYPDAKSGAYANRGYAEIVDFGVLEKYRRRGIGSRLMDIAERIAFSYSDVVYLGVGLHSGYGSAQRMYVKRGYIPDGSGVWYKDQICEPYQDCCNDDDLVLYLAKHSVSKTAESENTEICGGNIMKQYIVDAFTNKPFAGNPAAVCVMESWPTEESMMKLAMENNLSETAFIVKEEQGYHLRWFTPGTEVELCGHATLASSFVILNFYEPDSGEVKFNTLSGELTIRREGNLYEMDFPTYELKEIPVTDAMEKAFGARPVKAVLGLDLICVFDSEDTVRNMNPDQQLLTGLEGRIQNATACGTETDCVSRSFCPKLSIAEDPVCGSAHCQIAAFWAEQLNKEEIYAYQASKRGGYLHCRMEENDRIIISGEAALAAVSEIVAEL